MKIINVNGKKIKVFSSIDELPIINFQKYNKYLLFDSGIGSDIDAVDEHIIKVAKFIQQNDREKALQELQNMRQNLYMINSEISPKHLAFTALIYSIDDKPLTDLSDENLQAIFKELNTTTRSTIISALDTIKKKLDSELENYFPGNDGPKEKEAYDRLKQRSLLLIEKILHKADTQKQIEQIDEWLFKLYSPKSFNGPQSVEISYDKAFESSCLLISQKSGFYPHTMTVLQFYSALDNIKKQLEAEAKSYQKLKNK